MKRFAIALLLAISVVGCVGGGQPGDPAATAWKNAKTFAAQVNKSQYRQAAELAAVGSAAERYLGHMVAIDKAAAAVGYGQIAPEARLTYSDEAKTITLTPDGQPATVWGSFTYDAAGLLTGWTTGDGLPLAQRLWTAPAEASTTEVEASLVSAYRNDAGLWVVLELGATTAALAPECTAVLESKGAAQEAAHCIGPSAIAQGESALVAFMFEGAELGGTLRYPLGDADGEPVTLEIG